MCVLEELAQTQETVSYLLLNELVMLVPNKCVIHSVEC